MRLGYGLGLDNKLRLSRRGSVSERFTVSTVDDAGLIIGPVRVNKVRRIGGSPESVALYDNGFSAAGNAVFSKFMQPGEEVTVDLEFVNGVFVDVTPELGPELVVNGGFDTNINGWASVSGSVISWTPEGRLQMVSAVPDRVIQTVTGLVVGQTYQFSAQIVSVAGAGGLSGNVRLTTSTDGSSTGQIYVGTPVTAGGSAGFSTTFVANATSITVAGIQSAPLTVVYDNFSIKRRIQAVIDGLVELEVSE